MLRIFENGNAPFELKPYSRLALVFISAVFLGLATAVPFYSPEEAGLGYLIPVVIFGIIAFVGLVIGLLGTDRAVANIWGNR